MSETLIFIGIDVAKAQRDLAVHSLSDSCTGIGVVAGCAACCTHQGTTSCGGERYALENAIAAYTTRG